MVNIQSVANAFFQPENIENISPISDGLINDTYKVRCKTGLYILQRVNHEIFRDPNALNHNILRISKQLREAGFPLKSLNLCKDKSNQYTHYFQDSYWRVMEFIDGNVITHTDKPEIIEEAGSAFGNFLKYLQDIRLSEIKIPISGFVDFKKRFNDFIHSINTNHLNRSEAIKNEIDTLLHYEEYLNTILELLKECPDRLIHADPKLSNILFKNKKAVSVIDWDTCTIGPLLYDFSDMIRSFTNTSKEDDPDIEKVNFNYVSFQNLSRGFFSCLNNTLTTVEKSVILDGIGLLTYIQALRFYADYLNGDIYYKINYPEHNLIRGRNQLQLFLSIQEHQDDIRAYLIKILSSD